MGLTAENVADRCSVTREAQDEWAALSQQRAVAAVERRATSTPRSCPSPRRTARRDQGTTARGPGTTVEKLATLKPVFREDGTVTPATPARSTTAPPPC
jgi:acetyl-CoA C-acetyltransferase